MALYTNKYNLYSNRRSSRSKIIAVGILLLVLYVAFSHIRATGHPATKQTTKLSTKQVPTQLYSNANSSDQKLDTIISTWATKQPSKPAVVLQELTGTHPQISTYNQNAEYVTASTFKLYIAYAVLHGVEQGSYTMSTTLNDGNSLQTDLRAMIINSDNDASRTLGFMYGWKNADVLLKTQGINNTELFNYVPPSTAPVGDKTTTANDLALFLQKLYTGKLLNTSNTQFLLSLMKQQQYRERIPAGVPSGIAVADKPGWLTGDENDGTKNVEHDAAIVYGPKSTYILVLMTDSDQTQPLADLSNQLYTYLQS